MKTYFSERKLKILVMDTPIGSGHVIAAQALQEELVRRFEHAEILHVSTFDFLPRSLAKTFVKLYLLSLKISPKIYAFLYKWGNKKDSTVSRDLLNFLLARLAKEKIVSFQPDIAVVTHATPAGIIAKLKADGLLPKCQIYGVVTDYVLHNWWYYQELAAYFTADMPLENIEFAATQRVYKYGIPLRAEFAEDQNYSKAALREKLQLPSSGKIYLLLGGGEGILPMRELIIALKNSEPTANIVVITGHNKKLYQQITAMNTSGVQVWGFVNNIQEFLGAVDCVISKAGGISSTEILSQGSNYIIYKPLPGQELNNAVFLQKNCGVQIAEDARELIAATYVLGDKQDCRGSLVPCDSTQRIVAEIFNLTKKADCEYNV